MIGLRRRSLLFQRIHILLYCRTAKQEQKNILGQFQDSLFSSAAVQWHEFAVKLNEDNYGNVLFLWTEIAGWIHYYFNWPQSVGGCMRNSRICSINILTIGGYFVFEWIANGNSSSVLLIRTFVRIQIGVVWRGFTCSIIYWNFCHRFGKWSAIVILNSEGGLFDQRLKLEYVGLPLCWIIHPSLIGGF